MAKSPARPRPSGPVLLFSSETPPVVMGTSLPILTSAEFAAVLALVNAGPDGLTRKGLRAESGYAYPEKALRSLKESSKLWDAVIFMASKPHGRYRVGWPESDTAKASALSEKQEIDLGTEIVRLQRLLAEVEYVTRRIARFSGVAQFPSAVADLTEFERAEEDEIAVQRMMDTFRGLAKPQSEPGPRDDDPSSATPT